MNGVLDLLAGMLVGLTNQTGSVVLALGVYTLLASIIMYPMSRKSAENILLSELLRDDMAEIREKHKKHPEKAEPEIQMAFARRHYGMFASSICTILQGALGLLLALAFRTAALQDVGEPLFGVALTQSPFSLRGVNQDLFLTALAAAAVAVAVQYGHDQLMQKDLVTDQKIPDLTLLLLIAAGCVFLPLAFALYWALHEVLDIAVMLLTCKAGRERFMMKMKKLDAARRK